MRSDHFSEQTEIPVLPKSREPEVFFGRYFYSFHDFFEFGIQFILADTV